LPWELLALTDDRGIPGPQILNEFAVSLTGVVKLLEFITFPIGGDVERRQVILATDHESTTDQAVMVLTVNRGSTEEVPAGSLQTGEETS
jgi:hypothetical protein